MTDKYIDMKDEVREDSPIHTHVGIVTALLWLDEHPDQVPGRTITESELEGVNEWLPDTAQIGPIERRDVAEFFGITVVPDPEPTNAEKLEKIIWESDGPVASISLTRAELLAKWLDERGVKAPGGDDE